MRPTSVAKAQIGRLEFPVRTIAVFGERIRHVGDGGAIVHQVGDVTLPRGAGAVEEFHVIDTDQVRDLHGVKQASVRSGMNTQLDLFIKFRDLLRRADPPPEG